MKTSISEPISSPNRAIANNNSNTTQETSAINGFKDNRAEAIAQAKLSGSINSKNDTAQSESSLFFQLKNKTSQSSNEVVQRYYVMNPLTQKIRWENTDPLPRDYVFQYGTFMGDQGLSELYYDSTALDSSESEISLDDDLSGDESSSDSPSLPLRVSEPGGNHRIKNKLNVRHGDGISAAIDPVLTIHTKAINDYLTKGKGGQIAKWCGSHWEFTLPGGIVYMTHEQDSRSPNQLIPLRGPGIASLAESGLEYEVFLKALNIARNYANLGIFTITKNKGGLKKHIIQAVLSMLKS